MVGLWGVGVSNEATCPASRVGVIRGAGRSTKGNGGSVGEVVCLGGEGVRGLKIPLSRLDRRKGKMQPWD